MPERDPYDFSALAPDSSELEEGAAAYPSRPATPGLEDEDFEAELELLASEEQALALDSTELDAQFRSFQRVLTELAGAISAEDLDAEEAWLESVMSEEAAAPATEPGP